MFEWTYKHMIYAEAPKWSQTTCMCLFQVFIYLAGKNLSLGYAFSPLLGGVIWLVKILNSGETEKHLSNEGVC